MKGVQNLLEEIDILRQLGFREREREDIWVGVTQNALTSVLKKSLLQVHHNPLSQHNKCLIPDMLCMLVFHYSPKRTEGTKDNVCGNGQARNILLSIASYPIKPKVYVIVIALCTHSIYT